MEKMEEIYLQSDRYAWSCLIFTYEVSRSLAACEGAILVIDAFPGSRSSDSGNTYLALQNNLFLIPVINKIDLAQASRSKPLSKWKILLDSRGRCNSRKRKKGTGIKDVLEAVAERIPPPKGNPKLL